jgi:hypothetical protein
MDQSMVTEGRVFQVQLFHHQTSASSESDKFFLIKSQDNLVLLLIIQADMFRPLF